MQVYDFFSGIGGFSIAAEAMGWQVVSHCEIDPFCQDVLKMHWPDVYLHDDITTFTYDTYQKIRGNSREQTVFAGGFPCQPFSTAGKRKGTSDHRNLWPEYYRVIRECKPTYVVGENVPGLLSMENGSVYDGIIADLESQGYQVESYLIPACGVEGWHKRERTWIIAYSEFFGRSRVGQYNWESISRKGPAQRDLEAHDVSDTDHGFGREARQAVRAGRTASADGGTNVRHTSGPGLEKRETSEVQQPVPHAQRTGPADSQSIRPQGSGSTGQQEPNPSGEEGLPAGSRCNQGIGEAESGMGGMVTRFSTWLDGYWDHEPEGIPRVNLENNNRKNRLVALGNAVVPQLVLEIFRAIEIHQLTKI